MIANILLIIAMFFFITGAIGVNRFKGTYAKLLTGGLIDTTGLILLVIGLILKSGWNGITIRIVIVLLFVLLSNPVINHVVAQAAKESEHD